MDITLNFVSAAVAQMIHDTLQGKGGPTENRVLILTPNNDTTTKGGLIIPGTVKEGIPRKGVVILNGSIDEAHNSYRSLVRTGNIVTYGMYAGKEIEFDTSLFSEGIQKILEHNTFSVLSLNEIIYAEENNPNI